MPELSGISCAPAASRACACSRPAPAPPWRARPPARAGARDVPAAGPCGAPAPRADRRGRARPPRSATADRAAAASMPARPAPMTTALRDMRLPALSHEGSSALRAFPDVRPQPQRATPVRRHRFRASRPRSGRLSPYLHVPCPRPPARVSSANRPGTTGTGRGRARHPWPPGATPGRGQPVSDLPSAWSRARARTARRSSGRRRARETARISRSRYVVSGRRCRRPPGSGSWRRRRPGSPRWRRGPSPGRAGGRGRGRRRRTVRAGPRRGAGRAAAARRG